MRLRNRAIAVPAVPAVVKEAPSGLTKYASVAQSSGFLPLCLGLDPPHVSLNIVAREV